MNKATALYELFFAETGDKETAKKCVLIFLAESEKLLLREYSKETESWWFHDMPEIRQDLNEI